MWQLLLYHSRRRSFFPFQWLHTLIEESQYVIRIGQIFAGIAAYFLSPMGENATSNICGRHFRSFWRECPKSNEPTKTHRIFREKGAHNYPLNILCVWINRKANYSKPCIPCISCVSFASPDFHIRVRAKTTGEYPSKFTVAATIGTQWLNKNPIWVCQTIEETKAHIRWG